MATYAGTKNNSQRDGWQPTLWQSGGASKSNGLPIDKIMLAVVLGLTLFGLVMVYSASAMLAERNFGTQFYFLLRQSGWAFVGLLAMTIAMRIDYRHYKRSTIILPVLYFTVVLLVVVLFLPKVNNTHRWIRFGALSLQPSEIAKLALVAFLALFLENRSHEVNVFKRVFLPTAIIAILVIGLIGAEPDFGTALILFIVFAGMLFHAQVPLRHLATIALPLVPALLGMLVFVPWRLQRLIDFVDPWKNQQTSSYQVVQSLIAIGSGGLNGVGFAEGKQKLFYLPSPHTDFIFAVIGEELGLIGAITLVILFGLLAWRGFKAARYAPDLFGQLVAIGLTVMIIAQAFFNISVALSLLPAKGIPLPFISAGGSSLALSLFASGVLLNISKHEGS
ncbi:MAG: putative lipid II flippase FtsW [Acidobacteria bacterium]|nr:putative lipid II flippase FtsW [Acidobacteriota bacterium]